MLELATGYLADASSMNSRLVNLVRKQDCLAQPDPARRPDDGRQLHQRMGSWGR